MGFGGRIINQLRAIIGLDTLADEIDRKINHVRLGEQQELQQKKLTLQSKTSFYQYQNQHPKKIVERLDQIIANFERVRELAEKEVEKSDSGMLETIANYTANISTLNIYIEALKNQIDISLFVKYKVLLEQLEKNTIERYINNLILGLPQDDGQIINNQDILFLLQLIDLQISQIYGIQDRYNGYARLKDLYNQIIKMRENLNLNIQQNKIAVRPYELEIAKVQHELDSIKKEREGLILSKKYLELDKDRKVAKK